MRAKIASLDEEEGEEAVYRLFWHNLEEGLQVYSHC